MKCPLCGTPGAYVGFREIECKNSSCPEIAPEQPTDFEVGDVVFYQGQIFQVFQVKPPGYAQRIGIYRPFSLPGTGSQTFCDPGDLTLAPTQVPYP